MPVERNQRAAYAKTMRRTSYIALRDLNRASARVGREAGKAVLAMLTFLIVHDRDRCDVCREEEA